MQLCGNGSRHPSEWYLPRDPTIHINTMVLILLIRVSFSDGSF